MTIFASDIARFLGKKLVGKDLPIVSAGALSALKKQHLFFANSYTPDIEEKLNSAPEILLLLKEGHRENLSVSHIMTSNPRRDFAKVIQRFFVPAPEARIADSAIISSTAKIGNNVRIGQHCVIGAHTEIGDNTEIRHHVVVGDHCIIGKNCLIKSNTVIGEEGFGFDFEEDGTPIRIPHIGRVIIGNNVEIGALNTVVRATLGDTVIADNVKTDDHIHMAHNISVGKNTLITACAEISGSVTIGENVWVGPQASIMNKISVGDNVFIGLGAVVTKTVKANAVIAGNPAKVLRQRA